MEGTSTDSETSDDTIDEQLDESSEVVLPECGQELMEKDRAESATKVRKRKARRRRIGKRSKVFSKGIKRAEREERSVEISHVKAESGHHEATDAVEVELGNTSDEDETEISHSHEEYEELPEELEAECQNVELTSEASTSKIDLTSSSERKYERKKVLLKPRMQHTETAVEVFEGTQNFYDELIKGSIGGTAGGTDDDLMIVEDVGESVSDLEDTLYATPFRHEFPANTGPFAERYSPPMDVDLEDLEHMVDVTGVLVHNLLLLLNNREWIVDRIGGILRMYLMNSSANVAVLKSISWEKGKVQVFIHSNLLPSDCFIYDMKPSDPQNFGDVCDNLRRLADLVEILPVCKGIQEYKEFWEAAVELRRGTIEKHLYQEGECFRALNCSFINTEDDKCKVCRRETKYFQKKERRLAMSESVDPKKVNNRYLSKEELLSKVEEVQREKRLEQKKLHKLRRRVRKLIREDAISIGTSLSSDLSKILHKHQDKMTDIQKLFWEEQVKALGRQKNLRSMRWNPMMVKIALHIQMCSPSAYQYLRDAGFVTLPSQRTLYDFTHFVNAVEGVQRLALSKMQTVCKTEDQKYLNLMFDEMQIRSDIVLSRRTGEVIGYTNLSAVEQEMANLESVASEKDSTAKQCVAKKVLVYMALAITTDHWEVVGIYSTDDLSAPQLYTRTWDMIYQLERSGLKVMTLICDGASVNKKFFKMHVPYDPTVSVTYSTKNIACGEDRPVFFITDPPHILKTLRNSLANSYAHKKSRKLWNNNQDLSWIVIEQLYEKTVKNKFKDHRLTKSHIKLTSFSCMNVSYAAQVLSSSVARALKRFKNEGHFSGMHVDELVHFIELINKWFDCLNGSGDVRGKRNKENADLLPYKDVNDPRFSFLMHDVLGYFKQWSDNVQARKGNFSKIAREKMMVSYQTVEGLEITIRSFVMVVKFLLDKFPNASVDARKFNQDKLEQHFGLLRMSGGACNNPDLGQVLQKSLSSHAQGAAALPTQKGNTEADRKTLQVDEEPLPKRKRN